MDQKRFLTAGEVFQLFGVDTNALNSLIESGEVEALPDRGTFKYRSEDFVRLVQKGKLSPRTAGEMFLADSKGDIPFLKIKEDDRGMKIDDNVSFIELDEDALSAEAGQNTTTPQTPVVPEPAIQLGATDLDLNLAPATDHPADSDSDVKVLEDDSSIDYAEPDVESTGSDSDVRLEGPISSSGLPVATIQKKTDSDSDVRLAQAKSKAPDSDSDVRIAKAPSTQMDSDSDVRLAHPVHDADSDSDVRLAMPPSARHDSDSDVRLSRPKSERPDSDSDVRIARVSTAKEDSDSDVRIAKSAFQTPDSDSDVKIAEPSAVSHKRPDSDSDVTILAPAAAEIKEKSSSDSDSDVVIAPSHVTDDSGVLAQSPGLEDSHIDHDGADSQISTEGKSFRDTSILLGAEHSEVLESLSKSPAKSTGDLATDDSGIGIGLELSDSVAKPDLIDSGTTFDFAGEESRIPKVDPNADSHIADESESDSGITMESVHDSGIAVESALSDSGISLDSAASDSGISLDTAGSDSGITLDSAGSDSGITLDSADSESGIRFEGAKTDKDISVPSGDSGIAMDFARTDSDIRLEPTKPDSGITLQSVTSDSGITLVHKQPDSGITLEMADADSGISIQSAKPDSGIAIETTKPDSGITHMGGESGIRLDSAGDSSIRLDKTDSGFALDEEPSEASATLSDLDFDESDSVHTQTLPLSGEHRQDSGFDVNLAESDHTMEMVLDDESASDTAATVIHKGRKGAPKTSNLSEAFALDDSLEVEELDISEDLEGVPEAEYSGEFAEAEEEVLEASDDDFSAGEISVAEEEISEEAVPVAKTRSLPKEPAWGMVAVGPVIVASVIMLVTVTVLWSGIATMWSGEEPSGPAGMLISNLAALSPISR